MTVLELDLSQRVTKVLDMVRHFTVNERIVLAKLLLDTVVAGDAEESTDWQSLGLSAFEAEWDNPSDAIYDDWRSLYLDRRLWLALGLQDTAIDLILHDLDLSLQAPTRVQLLAEKALATVRTLDIARAVGIDVQRLRVLLALP
jgi:hypothetical protein